MHRNMARRDDGFLSTRRKVAWMFFGLWAVVLVMAAVRYAVHGDMVVTLADTTILDAAMRILNQQ